MVSHAVVERRDLGEGRVAENRIYRDVGRPVSISYQPPPTSTRSSGVMYGQTELDASARRPVRPGLLTPGWLVWLVPPADDGRVATFRNRTVGDIEVLAEGIVPMFATRPDGWVLSADAPLAEPLPEWLFAELGGRWKRA